MLTRPSCPPRRPGSKGIDPVPSAIDKPSASPIFSPLRPWSTIQGSRSGSWPTAGLTPAAATCSLPICRPPATGTVLPSRTTASSIPSFPIPEFVPGAALLRRPIHVAKPGFLDYEKGMKARRTGGCPCVGVNPGRSTAVGCGFREVASCLAIFSIIQSLTSTFTISCGC